MEGKETISDEPICGILMPACASLGCCIEYAFAAWTVGNLGFCMHVCISCPQLMVLRLKFFEAPHNIKPCRCCGLYDCPAWVDACCCSCWYVTATPPLPQGWLLLLRAHATEAVPRARLLRQYLYFCTSETSTTLSTRGRAACARALGVPRGPLLLLLQVYKHSSNGKMQVLALCTVPNTTAHADNQAALEGRTIPLCTRHFQLY